MNRIIRIQLFLAFLFLISSITYAQTTVSLTWATDSRTTEINNPGFQNPRSRLIEGTNLAIAGIRWKKGHFSFGSGVGYGVGYLNWYPQSNFYDKAINNFRYVVITADGYYYPFNKFVNLQPFVKLSLGGIIHYPYEIGYDYIKTNSKPFMNLGIGVEYAFLKCFSVSYNFNTGFFQHEFSLYYSFSKDN